VCGADKNKRGATFAQRSRIILRTLPPTHTPVKAVIFTVFAMMAQAPRSSEARHPDRSAGSIALPRGAGALRIPPEALAEPEKRPFSGHLFSANGTSHYARGLRTLTY
jgi:hypothetical protein